MDEDLVEMTVQDAIIHIGEFFGVSSMYALANALSGDDVTVQPIQISNYKKGAKPSQAVADRFEEVYGIRITNAHKPGRLIE